MSGLYWVDGGPFFLDGKLLFCDAMADKRLCWAKVVSGNATYQGGLVVANDLGDLHAISFLVPCGNLIATIAGIVDGPDIGTSPGTDCSDQNGAWEMPPSAIVNRPSCVQWQEEFVDGITCLAPSDFDVSAWLDACYDDVTDEVVVYFRGLANVPAGCNRTAFEKEVLRTAFVVDGCDIVDLSDPTEVLPSATAMETCGSQWWSTTSPSICDQSGATMTITKA